MTRQEIEDLAIQAGIKSYVLGMATEEAWQQTERFVELILKKGKEKFADRLKEEREKEREECAKVAEWPWGGYAKEIAAAIRARGNTNE
jgi:hypothetical protein